MTTPDTAPTPSPRIADAPGMLEYFEDLGDELQRRYEEFVPSEQRFHDRRDEVQDTFPMESGGTVELQFLTGPELYRNPGQRQSLGLPELWLPSGHLRVTTIEDDGTELLKSYLFGRSLARRTHVPDDAYLVLDRYARRPGQSQQHRGNERLFHNNQGLLTVLHSELVQFDTGLKANPSQVPKTGR